MRIFRRYRWPLVPVCVLLLAGLALAGCNGGSNVDGQQGSITVAGSTTVQPVVEKLANSFIESNPGIKVTVQGGGSSVGVTACNSGTVHIGAASRELKASEPPLVVHLLARDGIAIVTNPGNPVNDLSIEQVKHIFAGQVTNWSQVDASLGNHPIVVIAREEGSGTRAAFQEMIMEAGEKAEITGSANLFPSNGALRTAVSTTPWSIGFLSFGYLDSSLKALSIGGVPATMENALRTGPGAYPVVRPLYLLTKTEPSGIMKAFLDFCKGAEGQAIVEAEGFLRVD